MNYEKYSKQIENIIKDSLKKEEELKSKLITVTAVLKDSNGNILDKKTNLTMAEAYSGKYENYTKTKNKNMNINAEILKLKEELTKSLKELRVKIKEEFLKDLSEEFNIDLNILKEILNISLQKNSLVLNFYIGTIEIEDTEISYLMEEISDIDYFINKSDVNEHIFNFIYKIASLEVKYFKLLKGENNE